MGSLPLSSKATLFLSVSKPEAVLFPVSDWHPRDEPQKEGDVGPSVHHVYEVRRARSRADDWKWRGGARMKDREGGTSMSDRGLGPE